jgi:hypothetical protein
LDIGFRRLVGLVGLAGDDVEVVDHRDPAEVEQVLALAEVAGTTACQRPTWARVCSTVVRWRSLARP